MYLHRLLIVLFAAALILPACGAEPDGDGEFEEAAPAGKADELYGACQIQKMIAWVNNPETGVDAMKAAGVHTRAAKNIVAHRDGPDGMPGTADDDPIESAEELDAISYVGPKAFAQVIAAIDHMCQVAGTADVIFSPQPYESSHLVRVANLIDSAEKSVDIAMYSFRDSKISEALERAVNRGVPVRFIFESANEDRKEPEGSKSARLEDIGINVRYVNKIMHHKFAIIDGPTSSMDEAVTGILLTGSGNWSNSAGTRYDENTVIIQGVDELLMRYQQEFNYVWANSRDFVWNESLDYGFTMEITDAMIPDNPAVDAAFTSANFTIKTTSYGPTFSVVRGSNEVADRLVELIHGATQSIHIASGHLRSRPVSEAVLARYEEDPDLDIRVYLDGQEYISYTTHNNQENDLESCLEEAGTSVAKQQDCMDKGFYFSYPLYEAGIALRFKYYCYRWNYAYAEQMHHKYMVVDGRTLVTGSYNLSDNAEHNTIENVIIVDRALFPGLVDAFEANFETLWMTNVAEGLYGDLMDLILNTDEAFPVVFTPMALTWQEVNDLKGAMRDNCPDINSHEWRTNPGAHRTCYR